MNVDEVSISLTSGRNSDNMAAWSQDDDALLSDEDETIFDNPSFNGTPLNETVGDKSINQQDLETTTRQLNEREKLANTDDKSILNEMNTDADDNPEEVENLETTEITRRSTRIQIKIMPAEGVI